jgi:methylmalonyl-CoA mutase cobalamin-binding subunit
MPSETLGEALALHAVGQQQIERLLQDIGAIVLNGHLASHSGGP